MVTMVALLRGVNVGGSNKLPMADLRTYATDAGYEQVSTYIQSGNLVFSSEQADTSAVAATLEQVLAERAKLAVEVMVRSRAEFVGIAADNPFLARGVDPGHLHVACMNAVDAEAGAAASALAEPGRYPPDEALVLGAQMYLHLPAGTGRSKLGAALARSKRPRYTVRNWRTVNKLVDMLNEVDEN
ncbi:MAG: DUF1697 domain-containing protein [Acidimicrobiales bacterium]